MKANGITLNKVNVCYFHQKITEIGISLITALNLNIVHLLMQKSVLRR